jgi:hypothetical protein
MESHENEFTANRPDLMSSLPDESPEFSADVSNSDGVPCRLYTASLLGFFGAYQPGRVSQSGRDPAANKASSFIAQTQVSPKCLLADGADAIVLPNPAS